MNVAAKGAEKAQAIVAGLASSVQQFSSGATRSADEHKYDFEGFLSPAVLEEFGRYMHEHRVQRDGTIRASDNWQHGIPIHKYVKSLVRHVFDLWRAYRGSTVVNKDTGKVMTMMDLLMAIIFNAQGMAHEMLKCGGCDATYVCDTTREAIEQGRPFSFYCLPSIPEPEGSPEPVRKADNPLTEKRERLNVEFYFDSGGSFDGEGIYRRTATNELCCNTRFTLLDFQCTRLAGHAGPHRADDLSDPDGQPRPFYIQPLLDRQRRMA